MLLGSLVFLPPSLSYVCFLLPGNFTIILSGDTGHSKGPRALLVVLVWPGSGFGMWFTGPSRFRLLQCCS